MPYAIYGHSFGALLGYELTLRIEREIEQGSRCSLRSPCWCRGLGHPMCR